MAQVYKCRMTAIATVNIRANSAEEVQEWINTHSIDELYRAVSDYDSAYDIEYDDQVISEVDEDAAIDISDEDVSVDAIR